MARSSCLSNGAAARLRILRTQHTRSAAVGMGEGEEDGRSHETSSFTNYHAEDSATEQRTGKYKETMCDELSHIQERIEFCAKETDSGENLTTAFQRV